MASLRDRMPVALRVIFFVVGVAFAILAFAVIQSGRFDFVSRRGIPQSVVESEEPVSFWGFVFGMVMFSGIMFYATFAKGRTDAQPPKD
jgi:hypothetical protein